MPKSKLFDPDVVLDKALDVFWKKGFNGTSLDDLVTATGLSRSSLYDTFENKEKLYMASLKRYREQTGRLRDEALNKISSPRKKIETFFRLNLQDILKDPDAKGCFMVNATCELANRHAGVAKLASTNFQSTEDYFFDLIKQGQATGDIGKRFKARALARFLFNTLNGLRVLGQTRPDKARLDDVIKVTLGVLEPTV